jgi:hypothetical protein
MHRVIDHLLSVSIAQPRNAKKARGIRSRTGLIDRSNSGGSKSAGMNWKMAIKVTTAGRDFFIKHSPQ